MEDYSAPVQSVASFSSWNRFGVEQLLKLNQLAGRDLAAGESLRLALAELSHLMSTGTSGNRQKAAEAASKSRVELDNWLKCSSQNVIAFGAPQLQRLAAASMQNQAERGHWEFTTQAYLAAVASRQAWRTNSSAIEVAQQLRSELLFRPSTNAMALQDEPDRNISAAVARLLRLLEPTHDSSLAPIPKPLDRHLQLVPAPHSK